MNILFLYTELADYTIACLKALKQARADIRIKVIHYPVNPEAPFVFDFGDIGEFSCFQDYPDFEAMSREVKEFSPHIIVCSGWVNRSYVRICRHFRDGSINVLTMDNHWVGNAKQWLFRFLAPFILKPVFRYCWVPGDPQRQYARKLSFRNNRILTGFYTCDLVRFNGYFEETRSSKTTNFPRRFLCVARYIPAKGYDGLWKAFIQWQKENPNEWELWCVGTGIGWDQRIQHPKIRHLGFVQGDQWKTVIAETGVFILNSNFEPWGVVVQEFAAAGYPLVLSNKVGARSSFLTKENGFTINNNDKEGLIQAMKKISDMPEVSINSMAKISHEKANRLSLSLWAETLCSLYDKK